MNRWVEQLTSEALEALRTHTDALAATIPDDEASWHAFSKDASPQLKKQFATMIDPFKVRHAQRFFATYGLQIGAALLCKALPDSYAAARGAQVLYLTGELVSTPARRVRETTQFVITIMEPSLRATDETGADLTSLHPGQPGAVAARRIRLFHQKTRDLISSRCTSRWDSIEDYFERVSPDGPQLGEPLNQEDLIGTLHEFTVGLFESLNLLGVPYTDDDKEAWFHVWDVVACHMGVGTTTAFDATSDEHTAIADECRFFLPLDPELSGATLDLIRRRHHQESVEGMILVNALLAELARPLQRGMKPFPAALMRYLLGNETANLLGIARGGWLQHWLISLNSMSRVNRIVARRRKGALVRLTTSELSAAATQELISAYVEQEPREDLPAFKVSPRLANTWGIGTGPRTPPVPAVRH